jgi:hypothetical protein
MNIDEIPTDELKLRKTSMENAMVERNKAAKHPKFNKMEFPPHGDNFMNLYNDICKELEQRNDNKNT